jgi:hypothetical protein
MPLVLEQTGYDLLQGPLTIAKPEAAGGWDSVELRVGQVCLSSVGVNFNERIVSVARRWYIGNPT